MKTLFLTLYILLSSSFYSDAQTYEVYQGDTINTIDINGKKQGVWISFYSNGRKKSEISYTEGEKNGYAKIYFENGNIAEEGTWVLDKWVGKYKSYYRNGKLSYLWNYNEKGSRSGYQQYFYENGNLKIEGEWENGKENGVIKDYYSNGALKCQRVFQKGKIDSAGFKEFKKNEQINEKEIIADKIEEETIKPDSIKVFSGSGYHKFYNIHKKVEKEGEFRNGILMNGKQFIYNSEGTLIKTILFENGQQVDKVDP